MQKLDARSHRSMPWKNGGGITTEVARFPEGDSLAAFEWRISMARVESAGPFSVFEGVDRSLALLAGPGMTLAFAGRGSVSLEASSPPFAFPADIVVDATLAGGGVEDLNVMTRRGHWRHLLTRFRSDAEATVPSLGDRTLLLVVGGGATVTSRDAAVTLGPRDAVLWQRDETIRLSPAPACDALIADLWRL